MPSKDRRYILKGCALSILIRMYNYLSIWKKMPTGRKRTKDVISHVIERIHQTRRKYGTQYKNFASITFDYIWHYGQMVWFFMQTLYTELNEQNWFSFDLRQWIILHRGVDLFQMICSGDSHMSFSWMIVFFFLFLTIVFSYPWLLFSYPELIFVPF